MEIEEWRDVKGYEGLYQVSNFGNVWSFYVNRALAKHLHPNGYYAVRLCKCGRHKNIQLGRIVASAFLPNPNNLPETNHKDCNPRNNRADNLEWCTRKYNINYGDRTQKMLDSPGYKSHIERLKVPILQFQKSGEFVKRWDCASDIEKTQHIDAGNISLCCSGKRGSAGGYIWRCEL